MTNFMSATITSVVPGDADYHGNVGHMWHTDSD